MPVVKEHEILIQEFPFLKVSVWGENTDRYFKNSNAMVKWVDQPAIVPFLKYIDEVDKQSFRNLVVDRMIEETLQSDTTCFETFRRVNVFAKK